jgi:hypothetical protein
MPNMANSWRQHKGKAPARATKTCTEPARIAAMVRNRQWIMGRTAVQCQWWRGRQNPR